MPVLPVASAILALASGTFTVTRYGAGTYVNGTYAAGSTSTFSITASVQVVRGRELQRLPEGERLRDYLNVFTSTELRTVSGTSAPDRIAIQGATYEVVAVDDWHSEGGFYKAICARMDAP